MTGRAVSPITDSRLGDLEKMTPQTAQFAQRHAEKQGTAFDLAQETVASVILRH